MLGSRGIVRHKPFQVIDGKTFVDQNPSAPGLAQMGAYPAHGKGKWIFFFYQFQGLCKLALCDQGEIALDIDMGGTRERTRRNTVPVVHREHALKDFLSCLNNPVALTDNNHAVFGRRRTRTQEFFLSLDFNHTDAAGMLNGLAGNMAQRRNRDTRRARGIKHRCSGINPDGVTINLYLEFSHSS
jgi:hypothetical protein